MNVHFQQSTIRINKQHTLSITDVITMSTVDTIYNNIHDMYT